MVMTKGRFFKVFRRDYRYKGIDLYEISNDNTTNKISLVKQ
jgi:hypothetical protein